MARHQFCPAPSPMTQPRGTERAPRVERIRRLDGRSLRRWIRSGWERRRGSTTRTARPANNSIWCGPTPVPSRSSAATALSRITVVTGSNPVSPTSNTPSQPHFGACFALGSGSPLGQTVSAYRLPSFPSPPKILLMAAASSPAEQLGGGHAFEVSATRHRHDR